ncbi:MAG: helix-turn-helix domain-containing protein [Candidatus Moranbacteria bacterium]|nr:helix-turn-helix domain-containing protein [Candidatus Moranbacteria bacterium]
MHLDELINAGLSENEAKVYLAALELGETSVYRLAKKSGVKRTTTYLAVETLKEKGLMSAYQSNSVTVCYAENPKKLTLVLEEKKKALDKIMPELLAFNNLIDKKPKIKYFEGRDSYKEVFMDILKYSNSETLITFNENFWNFDDFFVSYFIPKRKEKKIWARALFHDNAVFRDLKKREQELFLQCKLVPGDKFKVGIEMIIYGNNKVGFVSYEEEMAIIIESQKIHDTQKSFFETIWGLLPESRV